MREIILNNLKIIKDFSVKYVKFFPLLLVFPFLFLYLNASDITLATITGNSVSVGSQSANAQSATFSSDGSSMIIANFTTGRLYQYVLTTPWDLTTASYPGKTVLLPSVFGTTGINTLHLTDDGTRLFVLNFYSPSRIFQFNLTTPYDILSFSYPGVFLPLNSTTTRDGNFANPYGMAMSPTADKIFVQSDFSNRIIEFTLSTPGELSSYTLANRTFPYGNLNDGQELGIGVTPQGNAMYIVSDTNDRIHYYVLPNAWSLEGASYAGKFLSFNSTDTFTRNISFKRDGNVMYVAGIQNRKIYELLLSDTFSPTISSVTSSTSDGSYREGDSINIAVNFSENVTSTGLVTVTLETGSTDQTCSFMITNSSSGSCTYTVQNGDTSTDLDAISVSGTIEDASGNLMTDFTINSNLASNKDIVIDTQDPSLNFIELLPSSTSAEISWITTEVSSTKVFYGISDVTDFSTAETNISPRVLNHTKTLNNLVPCSVYKVSVRSKDSASNELSTLSNMFTTGCGVSEISTFSNSRINLTGGTLSIPNSSNIAKLIIPNNYFSTRSSFQINLLDTSNFSSLANSQSLADGNLFKLNAITDFNLTIPSFNANVTFEITYSDEVSDNFSEDSLKIYKFENGSWEDKNCSMNSSLNKITCELSNFSVYGLFGSLKGDQSNSNVQGSTSQRVVFSKDKRCHFEQPPELTWVKFEKPTQNEKGIYLNWTQINADKVNIKIDDGTSSFPWTITNVKNTGRIFLENVASWQKVKIQAINVCYPGDYSREFSYDLFPNGWYNK